MVFLKLSLFHGIEGVTSCLSDIVAFIFDSIQLIRDGFMYCILKVLITEIRTENKIEKRKKSKTRIMKKINKKGIVEGIISGDEVILKSFYKQNFPFIKNHILIQGGSIEDAEDVFQDALVALYLKLRSNKVFIQASVSTYFHAICKIMWLRHIRKERKWIVPDIFIDDHQDKALIITERILQKDRKNLFYTYFSTLQDTTKQFWQLVFEGKNHQEIASITGYSESYTRKKKSKTKKRMMQSISKDPMFKELVYV